MGVGSEAVTFFLANTSMLVLTATILEVTREIANNITKSHYYRCFHYNRYALDNI